MWSRPILVDEALSTKFYSKFQNYNLYYVRKTNIIDGFNLKTGVLGNEDLFPKTTIELLLHVLGQSDTSQLLTKWIESSVSFEIEYETMTDMVFSVSKSDFPSNNRVIMDNQTNALVNAYNQGNLEQQKVNRMGNQIIMYNQRKENNPIKIGDYKDDNIIYQTQYQIHNDHIEVNAFAIKNYILKNYYTGINSKIRTWVNATEEAIVRHDLVKYYCELSFSPKSEISEDEKGISYIASTGLLQSEFKGNLKYCVARFKSDDGTYYPHYETKDNWSSVIPSPSLLFPEYIEYEQPDYPLSPYYLLDVSNRLMGNSLIFTFGFDDNWLAGKSYDFNNLVVDASNEVTYPSIKPLGFRGGLTLKPEKYVDDVGEFKTAEVSFLYDIKSLNQQGTINYDATLTTTQKESILIETHRKPRCITNQFVNDDLGTASYDYRLLSFKKRLDKDNGEITKLSLQLEFCKDTHDLYFTKRFIERNFTIRKISSDSISIFKGTYNENSITLPNDSEQIEWDITVDPGDLSSKITIDFEEQYSNCGIYVYDNATKEIILGAKLGDSSNKLELYMNVLKIGGYKYEISRN